MSSETLTNTTTTTNTTVQDKGQSVEVEESFTSVSLPAAAAAVLPSPYPFLIPLPLTSHQSADTLTPPLSFSLVATGIYRSAFPSRRNFTFLQTLELKSTVYLCKDKYPPEVASHFQQQNIQVRCFPLEGNKEPFVASDFAELSAALLFALDTRNHPVLIHCNKGKHRTGVVVGVLRRLAGCSLSSAFAEYRQFLGYSLARNCDLDRLMIECFDISALKNQLQKNIPQEFRPDWIV